MTQLRPRAGFVHHVGLTISALASSAAVMLAVPSAPASSTASVLAAPSASASPTAVMVAPAPIALGADLPPQERLPLGPRKSGTEGVDAKVAVPRSPTAAPPPLLAREVEQVPLSIVSAPPEQVQPGRSPASPTPTSTGQSKTLLPSWLGDDVILRGVVPIAVVAILAVALRGVIAKGLGRAARPSGVLEILASYPTGRGQQVALLRLGRRVLVVSRSDRSMSTLCEVTDADEVAELIAKSREGATHSFARLLARRRVIEDPFAGVETIDLTACGRAARSPQTPRERTLSFTETRG